MVGVILMVAITVILAAVIGTFVLDLGSEISDAGPSAAMSFTFNGSHVTVVHDGGEQIEADLLTFEGSGHAAVGDNWYTHDDKTASGEWVSAGDVAAFGATAELPTVRVVWTAPSGEESSIVAEFNG